MTYLRDLFFLFFLLLIVAFQKKLPDVNQRVIDYTNKVMNTQVGTGECWDYTISAEYYTKAKRKRSITINKAIAGDFIYFNDVILKDQGIETKLTNHFAIIYDVKEKGAFIIAHQNHNSNKKVHTLKINTNNLTTGTILISRFK